MIATTRIFLVALVMTLLLGQMIADRMKLLRDGRVVELKTQPVDPRSLFRGDYIILTYPISRIDAMLLPGDTDFHTGDEIFITLHLDAELWQPTAIHKSMQVTKGDDVTIAGQVEWMRSLSCTWIPETRERDCKDVEELQIKYGIESFFLPEGTGKTLEEERNAGNLWVRIAVDEGGRAGIKALLLGGEVVYEETLF